MPIKINFNQNGAGVSFSPGMRVGYFSIPIVQDTDLMVLAGVLCPWRVKSK